MDKEKKHDYTVYLVVFIAFAAIVALAQFSIDPSESITGAAVRSLDSKYICQRGQDIGDIDGDGKVSLIDVDKINYLLIGDSFPMKICCFDANKDGKVSSEDLRIIRKIANGQLRKIGVCD